MNFYGDKFSKKRLENMAILSVMLQQLSFALNAVEALTEFDVSSVCILV